MSLPGLAGGPLRNAPACLAVLVCVLAAAALAPAAAAAAPTWAPAATAASIPA